MRGDVGHGSGEEASAFARFGTTAVGKDGGSGGAVSLLEREVSELRGAADAAWSRCNEVVRQIKEEAHQFVLKKQKLRQELVGNRQEVRREKLRVAHETERQIDATGEVG